MERDNKVAREAVRGPTVTRVVLCDAADKGMNSISFGLFSYVLRTAVIKSRSDTVFHRSTARSINKQWTATLVEKVSTET